MLTQDNNYGPTYGAPPIPQDFEPDEPRHAAPKRNGHAIAGYTLAGVLAVALAVTGAVALGTLHERDTMIASQQDELNAISGALDDAEADLEECKQEAAAYRDSSTYLATAFYDYLDMFPWADLDLTDANAAIDEANALGCLN